MQIFGLRDAPRSEDVRTSARLIREEAGMAGDDLIPKKWVKHMCLDDGKI